MPKGYWIVHVTVSDPEVYTRYLQADAIAFDKYGARFLVRGGRFTAPEGEARSRHVVIEFDSFEKALACYQSPEYQAALVFRKMAAASEVVILEGAP